MNGERMLLSLTKLVPIHAQGNCRSGKVNMDAEILLAPTVQQESLCNTCTVRNECAEFAKCNDFDDIWPDIWGGLTPLQRRNKRNNVQIICPNCECDVVISYQNTEQCTSCGISWIV